MTDLNNYCAPVPRGCGTRTSGSTYLTMGIPGIPAAAPGGTGGTKRIEDYLIDPPQPVPNWMNLAPLGSRLFARQDAAGNYVTHVADWVGSQHYPNVADAVEEIRRFGLSRKIAKTLLGQKTIMTWDAKARRVVTIPTPPLTSASRIFLAHSRAYLDNGAEYVNGVPFALACPKGVVDHSHDIADPDAPDFMCAGLWWQDIEMGRGVARAASSPLDLRRVVRTMPSFTYEANMPPPGVTPRYSAGPAFFASFSITAIEVIAGMPNSAATAATLAAQTPLLIRIVPN